MVNYFIITKFLLLFQTCLSLGIQIKTPKLCLVNFDIRKNVEHFLVWLSSNLLIQKSPTAEIIGICFIGTIVLIKYMPIIATVGLFRIDR